MDGWSSVTQNGHRGQNRVLYTHDKHLHRRVPCTLWNRDHDRPGSCNGPVLRHAWRVRLLCLHSWRLRRYRWRVWRRLPGHRWHALLICYSTHNTQHDMYAVQPAAWQSFDDRGCDYAANIDHAYRLCSVWIAKYGEDMVIYRLTTGDPIKWVRVTADEVSTMATESVWSPLIIDSWTNNPTTTASPSPPSLGVLVSNPPTIGTIWATVTSMTISPPKTTTAAAISATLASMGTVADAGIPL